MPTLQEVDNFLNDVSTQVSSWYTVYTGRPAIVPGTDPTLIALQQATGELPPPAPIPIATTIQSPDVVPLLLVVAGVIVVALILRE